MLASKTFLCAFRQWLGDKLSGAVYEHMAVAPQDEQCLRGMAALAAERYGLPVAPPSLPAIGLTTGASLTVHCRQATSGLREVASTRGGQQHRSEVYGTFSPACVH